MATKTKKSVKVSNGTILREFRKQNNLSQATIGKVVGRNARTISTWENGRTEIPSDLITILNKKYKIGLNSITTTTKTTKVSKKSTTWNKKVNKVTKTNKFSTKFSAFIKSTGLSVTEFCKKYDMSSSTIYRILNNSGNHYFSLNTLRMLAKDTDIVKLFTW